MRILAARLGSVAAAATMILGAHTALTAPDAAADVVGIAVMNTGSRGPAMGCAHTIAVGLTSPVLNPTPEFYVDDDSIGPVTPYTPADGARVRWTPTRMGWHTIKVVQTQPDRPVSVGYLDIEVRRAGIDTGSSCFVDGVFETW
ncbi:hypothetical protein IU431_19805 [Nocardia otitidiscaviarum]|uniref:hypothetical protein n=1 Tax=Nocardia otitidiscaviarum TaxID=1823 RepID=UPI0004A701C8|nr:hypothetical protein [Nocardia otitidiscaviarum]MBF6486382.1 hypothetical protein [Nocardia otitidiscaviarum]